MIYFIQGGDRIKIGVATDLGRRIKVLQTGCPYRLVVLGVMDGGPAEERALHARFMAHRRQGEWFAMDSEICDFIERCCRPSLWELRHTEMVEVSASCRAQTEPLWLAPVNAYLWLRVRWRFRWRPALSAPFLARRAA